MRPPSIPVPRPLSAFTVADQEMMGEARRYFEWQRQLVDPHLGSRVLEVGCGMGNFTELLLDRDLVVGVDIDARCISAHRQRFREFASVKSLHADVLGTASEDLSELALDSAVCMNVLEHIEHDVAALRHLRDALPRGSNIVVLVPAFMGLYGPIDSQLGHYRRYTKRTLADTARQAGLACTSIRYVNAVGFFGWWANARMFKRTEQSAAQIAWFDRWVVPTQVRAERWIAPPFGQSVLAVLRRP